MSRARYIKLVSARSRDFYYEHGKEREGRRDWTEHPLTTTGWPDSDVDLWESGKNRIFFTQLGLTNGIAITSDSGNEVEVWQEDNKILWGDNEYTTDQGVVVSPGQAVNPGGRAKFKFSEAGQSVELRIKENEQTVKEVKIVALLND
ncbi:MAG: hypothetical protein AAB430_01765 [Patescibacteria group bacterium]